ncbi:MAG: YraN family protein [Spirochaetaceae bacterium]|jgi:putative endonuclease|nr:YraN family protein [Spirochaetaceae bacterium]
MDRSHQKGREGERVAAKVLEEAGMQIIARNVLSSAGEVDLVALDGETIVFVEVKAWSTVGIEELRYAVARKKQKRIIETAKHFLGSHQEYADKSARFDVVFIGPGGVTHLASAFMERL